VNGPIQRTGRAPRDPIHPGPDSWWWLSFADGSRPKGHQFIGVVIVQGDSLGWAVLRAHQLGINPGGEVQAVPLTRKVPSTEWRERLLTFDECEEAGKHLMDLRS
jgi:hypothetical protein